MTVSILQMEKLLKGQYTFKQWGFSMLLTRLKQDYAGTPTAENLEICVDEINAFLNKYKAIMAEDYALIEQV